MECFMSIMRWLYLVLLVCMPGLAQAAEEDWLSVAELVNQKLDSALTHYQAGDEQTARRDIIQAYFGPFEGEKMEAAIRSQLGVEPAFMLERQFSSLRKAIKAGKPVATVQKGVEELNQALNEHALLLNEAGVPRSVFQVNQ